MYLHFSDLNVRVYLTDVEIEQTLSSPVFNPLSGDWSYPFTFASSPDILQALDYPNLVNINRVATITYKVLLIENSLQLLDGVLALDYADENVISATLTVTPGNIPQAFWQKSLNKFDLGSDTIATVNADNTIYYLNDKDETGIYESYFGGRTTGTGNLYNAIDFINGRVKIKVSVGSSVLIDNTLIAENSDTSSREARIVFFNSVLNQLQQNTQNQLVYSKNSLIGIFAGIRNETLKLEIIYYLNRTTDLLASVSFTIQPKTVKTITNAYDQSLKTTWTKPYQFPEVDNTKHYTEDVFNGTINKTDAGKIFRNTNILTEKTKYSLVPMFYLDFVIRKIFKLAGYTVIGDFFENVDVKKLLIFNLYTTDKLIENINYTINIHNPTITYANHLPDVKFGEYLQLIIDEFGLVMHFNLFQKTVELSKFGTNIIKLDFLDLTGKCSYARKIPYRKAKKQQLKWNIAGDALAKENTAPYNPIPSDATIAANQDDFEELTLQIPSLTKNANRPQIEAQAISPLFNQEKNTSPLRFLFWDEMKGKIETNTLSFDLQKANGVYNAFTKDKHDFNNSTLYFEISATLTLQQLIEFSFLRKILAYDVFWLSSSISVKLASEKNTYIVQMKLRRYIG